MQAKDIMQEGVAVVSPELSLDQFEEFLTLEEIGGAPVVSADGMLVGIASKTDIVAALAERVDARTEFGADLTVQDVMTQEVVAVTPDASLAEVARVMLDGHLHRVVVTSRGSIVGIITPFDLLRVLVPEEGEEFDLEGGAVAAPLTQRATRPGPAPRS